MRLTVQSTSLDPARGAPRAPWPAGPGPRRDLLAPAAWRRSLHM